jgi:hypothetical protein
MSLSRSLSISFVLSLLYASSHATISTTGNLEIVNIKVAPDGYERSVISAGGEGVVGSLIKGNKGDSFSINVENNLTNDTMLTSTSIVSFLRLLLHGESILI